MIEIVIRYLVATFGNSMPEISNVNGLAEKIKEGDKEYPAIYCGKDEFQKIQGEDNYIYFRQLSAASEEESLEESVSGCDEYVKRTYPMIAVAYIPKSVYNTDNAYIDGKVSNNIANIIRAANYGSLNSTLQTENIYTEITSIQTDRNIVWAGEYTVIPMAARHDHVLCSVEFDIVIEATESCFKNFDCNDEEIVVNGDTINVVVTDPLAWHRNGDTVVSPNDKLGSNNSIDWDIIRGGAVVATVVSGGLTIPNIIGNTIITGNLNVSGAIDYASGAIQSLNGLTDKAQTFPAFGTTGTTPNVVSSGSTHTFNFPLAGSGVTSGTVSNDAQTFYGQKSFTPTYTATANDDFTHRIAGTITARAIVSDRVNGVLINPTLVAAAASQILIGNSNHVSFTAGGFPINTLHSLYSTNVAQSLIQFNNVSIPFTAAGTGVRFGIDTTTALIAGGSGVDILFRTNAASRGLWDIAGNFGVGLTSSITARFQVRGALNSNILYADTSTGAQIFLARESAGVRQIGLYGATPVARATTAGAAGAFVANTSNIANDTATFGGYTIGQIAQALINIGILT